jgi:hypothetical protein
MAAAAMGLKRQANDLVASVAVFQLPQGGAAGPQLLSLNRGVGLVRG